MAKEYRQYFYRVFNEFITMNEDNQVVKSYESSPTDLNIYDNIVPIDEVWTKIGIQASPGTWLRINDERIMIGKSGVFEVEDVAITSLAFEKKYVYSFDDKKTAVVRADAVLQQLAAKSFYTTYVETQTDLTNYYKNWYDYYNGGSWYFTYKNETQDDQIVKTIIQSWSNVELTGDDVKKYLGQKEAEQLFILSEYGVYTPEYKIDEDGKITDEQVTIDLENIIIDCIVGGEEEV